MPFIPLTPWNSEDLEFNLGTTAPPREDVYALADGQYARFWLGQWRAPNASFELAKNEERQAGFFSVQFRTKDDHRWAEVPQRPTPLLSPIKREPVFQDSREPLGMLWRNLCVLENELAEVLQRKSDCALVVHGDAFYLEERDGEALLVHANYVDGQFSEPSTRFDHDLEWVDIEEEELEGYNHLLKLSIDEAHSLLGPVTGRVEPATEDSQGESLAHITRLLDAAGFATPSQSGTQPRIYIGHIVIESAEHVAQDTGRGSVVVHSKSALDHAPMIGDRCEIRFRQGRGVVSFPKAQDADLAR